MKYLVIGASSGIGAKTADLLIQHGHQVYGTYNQTQPTHPDINFHHLDVMSSEMDLGFVPEQLDGLIYCPGSINLKPFGRIKPEAFVADYQLQVIGAIKLIQASLKSLKQSVTPSIVLFSTVAVQHGFPFHTQVAASKGAIEGLTKSLAAELAPKIRVNCIAPSLTDTPLAAKLLSTAEKKEANANRHPLKSIGTPDDMAEMVVFLLSAKSKWLTGQILHVDGGMSTLKV